MIRKILVLMVIMLAFNSCDGIGYDDYRRLIIEGRVVDRNGQPLENIKVGTLAQRRGGGISHIFPVTSSENELISNTTTDANGYYRMMFPKPSMYSTNVSLLVNTSSKGNVINSRYSNCVIYHIVSDNYTEFKLDMGNVSLYNPADSTTLTITGNLTNYNYTEFILSGLVNNNYFDYNFSLLGQNSPMQNEVQVAKNQILTMSYRERNQNGEGITDVQNVEITINEEPVIYNLD